ncbi:hypothetical protein ABW19_dt0206115 [Dactylella cylindrospora]|nr:hypothetical protein ABW19_dt0206115 [Dactylella cylindrospora]
MSKHNRPDPIPLEPTTKRPRLEDGQYNPHANMHVPAPSMPSSRYSAVDLLNPRQRLSSSASSSSSGSRDGRMQLPPPQQSAGDSGTRAANMLLNLHGVSGRSSPLPVGRNGAYGRQQNPVGVYGHGESGNGMGMQGHMRNGGFGSANGRSSGILSLPKVEDGSSGLGGVGGGAVRVPSRSKTPEIQFLNSRFASTASKEARNSVVDLTGDEDDDVIYSGTKSLPIICYGMIIKVQASIAIIPDPPPHLDPSTFGRMWPKIPVSLARGEPRTYVVNLTTASGKNVGSLRGANAKAMASLMDLGLVDRAQAFILPRYKGFEVAGQPTSQSLEMTITLYGTDANAKKVGNMLGQHNLFLQDPVDRDPSFPYRNPQYPEQPSSGNVFIAAADRAKLGKATYSVRTTEEVKNEITAVLDSLEKVQVLEETEAHPSITTPLLPHQKQGLNFMMKKETERLYEEDDEMSFWKMKISPGGVRMYHNVITGLQTRSKPPSCLGGILADDMGLGKTLTVLSLIVSAMEDSVTFGKRQKKGPTSDHDLSVMYAKTTLLICPLSVLVNWEDQIKTHVKPDTISYYVYHGNNRVSDFKELAKYDMVITTYALAASDFGKAHKDNGSVLQRIHWFRIVLDGVRFLFYMVAWLKPD